MSTLSTTADDILRCARALVVKGGYNGFSYADIAKVVGIRNASIHHHFPTKPDLVRVLVRQYRQEAEAGLAELDRHVPDPLARLRAYVGYWEKCIGDGSAPYCVCALLATELPALPPDVAAEVRAHFQTLSAWLTAVLKRGVKDGRLSVSGSIKAEAEAFMATVHGAMLSARAYGDASAFAAVTHPLLKRIAA